MKINNSCISKLHLVNFRNHSNFTLETEGKSFIIYGANGSGKTNILEAISVLSPGRGFKNSSLSDLVRFGESQCVISATITNYPIGGIDVDLIIAPNLCNTFKKNYYVDGKAITQQTLIDHYLNCIWLTPQMDNFFLQDNAHKRKFIDRMIFLTNKNHLTQLLNHEKLIRERNKILQQYAHTLTNRKISSWLTQIEHELARLAVSIVINRNNFLEAINIYLQNHKLYPTKLSMSGEIEEILEIHKYALPVENILKTKYEESRAQRYSPASVHLKNKTTLTNIGAHKSQLLAYNIKQQLYAEKCSTGEQKMLLINLITSLISLLINSGKILPCLLLDEIGVHLDDKNLLYVINTFLQFNAQIFITHTNIDRLRMFENNFTYLHLKS